MPSGDDFPVGRDARGALAGEEFVLFDGACGFCTWVARALRKRTAPSPDLRWLPYQRLADDELGRLGTTRERCARAVQYVARDGRAYEGADAFNRWLARRPAGRLAVRLLHALFPLLFAERFGYALVARARAPISAVLGTHACALPPEPIDRERASGSSA
ncbi:MAG TPA: DCC1-like thiol-disulfide oxidoreductase family protein [Candidatus Baltobacteraceae bacterium]|nr:DCC1-like thiol-disulfide oxidoreductase family protein [Candidatus Baltobacteraceae bacterium]